MTLPKWATTVTPLSKILALIIFITFPIIGFIFGMKYQYVIDANKISKSVTPIPTIILKPTNIPTIELTSLINSPSPISDKNKLFLVKKANNENVNIYSILPIGSVIRYKEGFGGYMSAEVTINGQEYAFSVQSGGRGGPCPMANDTTNCGYIDKKIDALKGITIEAVRIWKDDPRGIFLLDPWEINIEDKYNINSILVTKKDLNVGFTQTEVDSWLKIFSLISVEKF